MPYSLVVQTSFLGDVVLTTPLIAELASRGPVDVVVTPGGAPLLANNPDVRRVIIYDKRGRDRGLSGFRHLVLEISAARLRADAESGSESAAYLTQGSLRSAALTVAAGYGVRVGFNTSAGHSLYTRVVPYREDRHHAERLWRLSASSPEVEPDADALLPRLFPGADDEAAVDRVLRDAGYAGEPLVALAPGSVWQTKRWPYYDRLARALAPRCRIAVVGSQDDASLAEEIVAAAGSRTIDATGRLSLLGSAALIGRAMVLVTNDSAPQHLASAMRTPTITVFGPTVPQFGFGPLAPRSLVVGHERLQCRPCHRHGPRQCPLRHWRCMRELTPEDVARHVEQLAGAPSS